MFDNTLRIHSNLSQGNSPKVLFVCTTGMLRSPTAAKVALQHNINSRACGSNINIALIPITRTLISWADKVVFMHSENYDVIRRVLEVDNPTLLEELKLKSYVWDIEDHYNYDDSSLIWKIERLMPSIL